MTLDKLKAIRHSALWAAYGDALGFITELADIRTLQWRIKAPRVTQTLAWRRTIGGKFGVEATIPAGCYSDDTQLRLATCRSIRGDGKFDAEAFAKVELPVWLAYALGAGRGTKLAAASFRSPDVTWFSNFFDKSKVDYTSCGGNGAAMRIQPHIWAADNLRKPDSFVLDVLRNALCTHGHMRGVLGAVFHALCLAKTLSEGKVADPDTWKEATDFFPEIVRIMRQDPNLGAIWLSVWEQRTGSSIEDAIQIVRKECLTDIELICSRLRDRPEVSYCALVEDLGAMRAEEKGSGTKTAIIAAALSWIHKDEYPASALVKAANLLGSDTDTIATMAGALLGCVSAEPPRTHVLDHELIVDEASRMHRISNGEPTSSFDYPDLFAWHAPRTQLDAVGFAHGSLAVAGLGLATAIGPEITGRKNEQAVWQWLRLDFGQTIIAKRRETLRLLPESALPARRGNSKPSKLLRTTFESQPAKANKKFEQPTLLDNGNHPDSPSLATIDQLTSDAIKSDFNETLIGRHLLSLAGEADGIERAVAYASIIVKARLARLQASKNGSQRS